MGRDGDRSPPAGCRTRPGRRQLSRQRLRRSADEIITTPERRHATPERPDTVDGIEARSPASRGREGAARSRATASAPASRQPRRRRRQQRRRQCRRIRPAAVPVHRTAGHLARPGDRDARAGDRDLRSSRSSSARVSAFLVNPPAGAPQAFYKVQIGRYKDRARPSRSRARIKKEEQFQSWISR